MGILVDLTVRDEIHDKLCEYIVNGDRDIIATANGVLIALIPMLTAHYGGEFKDLDHAKKHILDFIDELKVN